MQMPSDARPRLIVLTGVSRGLGRALAEGFIRAGHTLVGCARSADAIAELRQRHAPAHRFDVLDVCDDGAVRDWADDVLRTHGAPELLINCAATMCDPAPLWSVKAAEFDALIDTNVKAVANVIRHVVPAMVEAGAGVIANFSSGWGRGTSAGVAPYCASKWAIEGLTRALAKELPAGMAAVPVDPGTIDTDMLARVRPIFKNGPQHFPTPATWAEKAVPFFLALGVADNGKPLTVPQ